MTTIDDLSGERRAGDRERGRPLSVAPQPCLGVEVVHQTRVAQSEQLNPLLADPGEGGGEGETGRKVLES